MLRSIKLLDVENCPIVGPDDEFYILGVDLRGGLVRIPSEYLRGSGEPVHPIDPFNETEGQ